MNHEGPPDNWPCIGEVYFNLEHQLNLELVEELRLDCAYAIHAAWHFNARIWFNKGAWHSQVWKNQQPVDYITGRHIDDVIDRVNRTYGKD